MEETKICVDCNTSKTPLWRSGPAGPKSLCNACGIRFRKKKSVVKKKPKNKEVVVELKKNMRLKLVALGKDVVLVQKEKRQKIQNHQLGEVEQAASLLMSLSYASVFG